MLFGWSYPFAHRLQQALDLFGGEHKRDKISFRQWGDILEGIFAVYALAHQELKEASQDGKDTVNGAGCFVNLFSQLEKERRRQYNLLSLLFFQVVIKT